MQLERKTQLACIWNGHLSDPARCPRGMVTVHCRVKRLSSKLIASIDYMRRHCACIWRVYVVERIEDVGYK